MDEDKQPDANNYHMERFPPIRPRPDYMTKTPLALTTATSSSARIPISALTMEYVSALKVPIPALSSASSPSLAVSGDSSTGMTSVATFTRGAVAPPLSTTSSQVPVMVVNPMQQQKSSVGPVTLSTQSVSTSAQFSTGAASSAGMTSVNNNVQMIAQRQPENVVVQGSLQGSGIVLGNSFATNMVPGSFVPNQLFQTSSFLGNVVASQSVQGGVVQGNFAQGVALPGGFMALNQVLGVQNTPQFAQCVLRFPGQNPQITLPTMNTITTHSRNTVKDTPKDKEKSTPVPVTTQSSYQFVIEPDPAFDKKIKGATIEKDVTIVSESITSGGNVGASSKKSKSIANTSTATEEEFLPKIEQCYSMKKLSLKEMMELLDKGQNVMTFVKPETNDYFRAKVLCEAVVKYDVVSVNSDIPDDFFTSLVSPYISLNEALHLKNEIRIAAKGKQKQKKTGEVSGNQAKSSDVRKTSAGMETAARILEWRTEKLENIDPTLYKQFCRDEETGVVTESSKSHPESSRKQSSSQELIGKAYEKAEESRFLKKGPCKNNEGKAYAGFAREETSSSPGCKQRQVVSGLHLTTEKSSQKTTEPTANLIKETLKKQILEQKESKSEAEMIRKIYGIQSEVSKENKRESTKDGHSFKKDKQKESESEAEMIRKAFTLSKFKHTEEKPSSTSQHPVLKTCVSLNPEFMEISEGSSESPSNLCTNLSRKENEAIKTNKSKQDRDSCKDLNKDDSVLKEHFQSDIISLDDDIVIIKCEPSEDMEVSDIEMSGEQERNSEHTETTEDNRTEIWKNPDKNNIMTSNEIFRDVELMQKSVSSASSIPHQDVIDITDAFTAQKHKYSSKFFVPNYETIHEKWKTSILKKIQRCPDRVSKYVNSYCYLCGLFFPYPEMAWQHIVNEHAKLNVPVVEFPKYICTHCNQIHESFAAVQKHEVAVHLCEFPCYFCGMSFDDSYTMLLHVISVHSRLFTCNICEGQFLGKWEFQKHCTSDDHRQSKPDVCKVVFLCLFCNCKFDAPTTLASHLINTHIGKPVSNPSECVCQSCRHQFLDAHALLNHRNVDARNLEKPRPVSTTSLVELTVQVLTSKTAAENLKLKQKKATSSQSKLDDLIGKNVSDKEGGYRELIINGKKFMYPFKELLQYCELGSDVSAESAVVIMDELIKFLIKRYPLLQIDTTNNDLHHLVAAVSRSREFADLLKRLEFKPLPWTNVVKKSVETFLRNIQEGCYKHAALTDLCAPLQKTVNFLDERLNIAKRLLVIPTTANEVQQVSGLSLPSSSGTSHATSGTSHATAETLDKTAQSISSDSANIANRQSEKSETASASSKVTISTSSAANVLQLPSIYNSAEAVNPIKQTPPGQFQLVRIGMQYMLIPVGQTLNQNALASQTVARKEVTIQNPSAGSGVTVNHDATGSRNAVCNINHSPSVTQHSFKRKSEGQMVQIDDKAAGTKKLIPIAPKGGLQSGAARVADAKKLIPIAPNEGLQSDAASEVEEDAMRKNNQNVFEQLKTLGENKWNESKSEDSDTNSEVEDVPVKELHDIDSLVARSDKLKLWFTKVKKPAVKPKYHQTLKKEKIPAIPAKVGTNIDEKESDSAQKRRRLFVNNRLNRLANKKKGFQIAEKYRTHTTKSIRELVAKWVSDKQAGKGKIPKKSKQSYGQILRKRKPVKYLVEEEVMVESDDETESGEEWKPSDIESEEGLSDGMTSDSNDEASDKEDFDAFANTSDDAISTNDQNNDDCVKNEIENVEIKQQYVIEKNVEIENNLDDNAMKDQRDLQEKTPMETENDCAESIAVETEAEKLEKMLVEKRTVLKNRSSKQVTEITKENENLSSMQTICLKRYAPGLLKEHVPSKIVKVANTPDSLHCCTMKMPWLNSFLKCGFVKIERNDQADKLGLDLVIAGQKDYTERKLTRNFVKLVCQKGPNRVTNEVLPHNSTSYIDQEDITVEMNINKSKSNPHTPVRGRERPRKIMEEAELSSDNEVDVAEEENSSAARSAPVRGRGRPRKNLKEAELNSITDGNDVKTEIEEDNTSATGKAPVRGRGRLRKKLKEDELSSITEGDVAKQEIEEVDVENETAVFPAKKKLRPRKKFSYFEEDSSDTISLGKNISDESSLDSVSVTARDDVNLSMNSASQKIDSEDYISTETRRMLKRKINPVEDPGRNERKAPRDANLSVHEKTKWQTEHVSLSLQIKQEVQDPDYLKGSANVAFIAPSHQEKPSNIATPVSQSAKKLLPKVLHKSAELVEKVVLKNKVDNEKLISRQFLSSSSNTSLSSAMSQSPAVVTQAASNSVTSSSVAIKVGGATGSHIIGVKDLNNEKPGTPGGKNLCEQAVTSEPSPSRQVVRYPLLVYPQANSNALSGLPSASLSSGSTLIRPPPPLVQMTNANALQTNVQPVAQTPKLNFGLNQTQIQQVPLSQQPSTPMSSIFFVPISGTDKFIPVNIPGGLNSLQARQPQQAGQAQQTNQFQSTGQIQPAQIMQPILKTEHPAPQVGQMVPQIHVGQQVPKIGQIQLANLPALTSSSVQLSSLQQNQLQHVQHISTSQMNSKCNNPAVQPQGVVIKQEASSDEQTDSKIPKTRTSLSSEPEDSGVKTSQGQQPLKGSPSEQQSTNKSVVLPKNSSQNAVAQPQSAIYQQLPLVQQMTHMQGLIPNQLPSIQTGSVHVPGMQPVLGIVPNQLQGLNQSGQITQGLQFCQTGVQQFGQIAQTQQQKVPIVSPQGTSCTLMVNQETPLAPGQLIYVPNSAGSDSVQTGQVNNAGQTVPVVKAFQQRNDKVQTEGKGNKGKQTGKRTRGKKASEGQYKGQTENILPKTGQELNPAQAGSDSGQCDDVVVDQQTAGTSAVNADAKNQEGDEGAEDSDYEVRLEREPGPDALVGANEGYLCSESSSGTAKLNDLCQVCGGFANRYHFGVLVCEACRAFFKHCINSHDPMGYVSIHNRCVVDKARPVKCKACRLRKCYHVGMSKDRKETETCLSKNQGAKREETVELLKVALNKRMLARQPEMGFKPEPRTCSKCQRDFSEGKAFTDHLDMHREGTYSCFPCRLHFQDNFDHMFHKALKHSFGFKCKICNATFPTELEMFHHSRQDHQLLAEDVWKCVKQYYRCLKCCATFLCEWKLRTHLVKHFGGICCEVCVIILGDEKALENHGASIHEKYYMCNVCREEYETVKDVIFHLYFNHKVKVRNTIAKHFSVYCRCKKCDKRFDIEKETDSTFHHFNYEHTDGSIITDESLLSNDTVEIMNL